MSDRHPHTLEYLAAKHAQALIRAAQGDKVEKSVTKTVGVLQENGVYACFLYLLASEKENGQAMIQAMLALLEEADFGLSLGPGVAASSEEILAHIADNVANDLRTLLLAKEALEQMLIYARYGAKARQKES